MNGKQGWAPARCAVTASPVLRIEPQSALRLAPAGRVPAGADDDWPCSICGLIDCDHDEDLPPYRGAFYTEGRH